MTTVAIMQPTYLPWIGYFDLIDQSDTFVFLDSVQFEPRSWQQRNRVKGPHGPIWLTVPVKSTGSLERRIDEVEIDTQQDFADQHLRTLTHSYRRAPHFEAHYARFEQILRRGHRLLADLNIEVTTWLCEAFGIRTPTQRSSRLPTQGARSDRLVELCRHLGADTYLSPEGSRAYLTQDRSFEGTGIRLRFHDYKHPEYPQALDGFVPQLSAIDLLFNHGPQGLAILRSGRSAPNPEEQAR